MPAVDDALKSRISTREFLPTPLSRQLVHEILDVARWAPSGGNLQPWKVIAVAGTEREAIIGLGYANDEAAINCLRSDRAEVAEFATFRGF